MEFAQNGKLRGDYRQNEAVKNQGIKAKICRALADAGYTYQLNVGHSKFKVDIAVINPYNSEEYLLGIMTDGDSYCQSANTKDREVAQFEVLKGLGWKLYRIWTMDWWMIRKRRSQNFSECLNAQVAKRIVNVRFT